MINNELFYVQYVKSKNHRDIWLNYVKLYVEICLMRGGDPADAFFDGCKATITKAEDC